MFTIEYEEFKNLRDAQKWIEANNKIHIIGFQEFKTEDESGYWDSTYKIWYLFA